MATTIWLGQINIMTMSWHTMMEFEPSLIGCVISNLNDSFNILKATQECVINILTVGIAEKVVGCGNVHGDKINKFEKFGSTPKPAANICTPLIDECYANFKG